MQSIPVNVCGQQVHASCGGSPSLKVLKEAVEVAMGIQQDWIEFYDRQGTKIMTDADVEAAIADERGPINATVAGHSVHSFEQRAEELAQMQWKVMRDQLTVIGLQMTKNQELLKELEVDMKTTKSQTDRSVAAMKVELQDGLQDVAELKKSSMRLEELFLKSDENVHRIELKVGEEIQNRDRALEDIQYKMGRQNESQMHETAKLAEAFDSCLKLLHEADGQLRQDVYTMEKSMEATREVVATWHEENLKQMSEARSASEAAIQETTSELHKYIQMEAELQVRELSNKVASIETRIIKAENIAIDTSNRWLASHDQLKAQCNSLAQNVEQCRLQNRSYQVSCQSLTDKLDYHAESLQTHATSIKEELTRERKDRQEQMKCTQQTLDGTLRSSITELEMKLSSRVDKEADERTDSIKQALDDIGTVIEKEIPSSLRSRSSERARASSPCFFSNKTPSQSNRGLRSNQSCASYSPVMRFRSSPVQSSRALPVQCSPVQELRQVQSSVAFQEQPSPVSFRMDGLSGPAPNIGMSPRGSSRALNATTQMLE